MGLGMGYHGIDYFNHQSRCAYFDDNYSVVLYGEVIELEETNDFDTGWRFSPENDNIAKKVLACFLAGGLDRVRTINGNFSLAVWEGKNRKLILCPDRYGLQPLFYTQSPGRLAFASEIKALLALPTTNPSLDEPTVMEMLTMDMVGFDRTYIKSIRRVPFGCALIYQDGKISLDERWLPRFSLPIEKRSDEDYLEEFIAIAQKVVSSRLSDQRVGISLSGGLDSRFLLGLAIKNHFLPTSVTYGTKNSRDLTGGTKAARAVGSNHIRLELREDYLRLFAGKSVERAEGFFNAFNCHAMILLNAAEICPLLAFGNGIDQLLYTTRSEYDLMGLNSVIENFYHNRNHYIPEKDWPYWFTSDWLKIVGFATREQFYTDVLRYQADCIDNQLDSYMLNYLANTTISGFATISQRIGYTAPFFDHELVNFCLQLPVRLRWRRELEAAAFEKISPALASIRNDLHIGGSANRRWHKFVSSKIRHGFYHLGLIPPANLQPPSATFTDIHRILRKSGNQRWLKNILLSSSLLDRGIFRREMLQKAVDDHFSGKRNYTKQLSTIATFELTMRHVVDTFSYHFRKRLSEAYSTNVINARLIRIAPE